MVVALVHFTVGVVLVLTVVSVVPITRYRLPSAYLGGVWALGPDVHHLLPGAFSRRVYVLHQSPAADLFFFHYTLDSDLYRAHNTELTFVSLAILGLAFAGYEWCVGGGRSAARRSPSAGEADESSQSN